MNTNFTTIILIAVTVGGMVTSNATVIFEADTTNSTAVGNATGAGTLTGSTFMTGQLVNTNQTNGANNSGFVSTMTIDQLLGVPLALTDSIEIIIDVDSITGNPLRANGIRFGFADSQSPPLFDDIVTGANSLGFEIDNNNNGTSTPEALGIAIGNTITNGGIITDASLNDGFVVTLTADATSFQFDITGVSTGTVTLAGALTNAQFLALGGTQLAFTSQQFNDGTSQVQTLNTASIHVESIPEPSSIALIGLGGVALILRRRRRVCLHN